MHTHLRKLSLVIAAGAAAPVFAVGGLAVATAGHGPDRVVHPATQVEAGVWGCAPKRACESA